MLTKAAFICSKFNKKNDIVKYYFNKNNWFIMFQNVIYTRHSSSSASHDPSEIILMLISCSRHSS